MLVIAEVNDVNEYSVVLNLIKRQNTQEGTLQKWRPLCSEVAANVWRVQESLQGSCRWI